MSFILVINVQVIFYDTEYCIFVKNNIYFVHLEFIFVSSLAYFAAIQSITIICHLSSSCVFRSLKGHQISKGICCNLHVCTVHQWRL